MAKEPKVREKLDVQQVNMRIAVTLFDKDKIKSCCNYDITGRTGNLLLVLPPMTHIQDMQR